MKLVCVPGTWALSKSGTPQSQAWWRPGSAFWEYMTALGVEMVGAERPFVWSTDLGGVFGGRDKNDWRAGGASLYAYIVPPLCPERRIPPAETAVVAHSHGGQVALLAAAAGLKIHTLLTIATPVRRDMRAGIAAARPNITHWEHIHSDRSDRMQWVGALFDGRLGIYRAFPEADVNVRLADAGHSRVLHDPAYQHEWARWRDVLARPQG